MDTSPNSIENTKSSGNKSQKSKKLQKNPQKNQKIHKKSRKIAKWNPTKEAGTTPEKCEDWSGGALLSFLSLSSSILSPLSIIPPIHERSPKIDKIRTKPP